MQPGHTSSFWILVINKYRTLYYYWAYKLNMSLNHLNSQWVYKKCWFLKKLRNLKWLSFCSGHFLSFSCWLNFNPSVLEVFTVCELFHHSVSHWLFSNYWWNLLEILLVPEPLENFETRSRWFQKALKLPKYCKFECLCWILLFKWFFFFRNNKINNWNA
jgi:hypothetical protein